ncbi:MAG: SusC/RagA family TonB-linked outer membrane protein [Niabella sp.]|nr:SusC/RagA family TonB-linked outer membrane protein [Niabella sp.]
MRQIVLLFTMLMAFSFAAFAQKKQASGKIVDEAGNAVPFATVSEKGTHNAISADATGTFSINVAPKATLVISATGFTSIEVTADDNLGTITLGAGKATNIDEVVVTALGISKNRRTLGYATQTLKSDVLQDKGDGSLLNALQGKLAGADITSAGGAAGASTSIILRGITSFTGSQSPLMVVDGVPVSDATDESTVGLYSNQSSNRLADLNINNIEKVDVLSGPAAAALYGSRAGHGAIMITTKKGSGKKGVANVVLSSSYTQQKVYGFPELQNRFGQGANGVFSAISGNSLGPAFGSKPSIVNGLVVAAPAYVNGTWYKAGDTIRQYQAYPDNIMSYFKTGYVFDQNLSINSGDEKNNYGVSFGNSKQEGILPNSGFNKTNVGFNFASQMTEKLSVRASAGYFSTIQQGPTQGSNGTYSAYANVYRMPRSLDFEYYKNNYTTQPGGYNNWYVPNIYNPAIQDSSSASDNPYFAAYKNPIVGKVSRVMGNATVGYDVLKWLNVSYRAGVDAYTDRRTRTVAIGSAQVVRSAFTGAPGTTTGGIMEDVIYRNEFNGDFMINAKKTNLFVNGLNATLLLGEGVNQQRVKQVNQTGYGLVIPDFYNITNATNLSLTNESEGYKRLWGVYGQLSLAYNNYLFLELTGRQDHSSTLPVSKNSYFYPSVSGSFIVTDALKIQSPILSFAKVRAAYAKVGNDAPMYSLLNTYSSTSVGNNVSNFSFPFGTIAGFSPSSTLANAKLKPEFTSTLDLGVNIGLFKNRLNFDLTVYNSKSTDQIVSVALPASSGYLSRIINIGEMTNKGVELTVNATPVQGPNFSWNISGNFSKNKNKVTKLADGVQSFAFGGISFSGLIPTIAVGEPYGIIRGSKFVTNDKGQRLVDSTTGLYLNYKSDQTVLNPNRDWIAGLTNTFQYKRFGLSVLVDYKQGGQFESFTVATLRANGSLKVTEDREQPYVLPGVIDMGGGKYRPNNIQINGQTFYNAALGSTTGSSTSNEFAVFDATTFRLREVSLSYDLLGTLIHTHIIKSMKFTVYGRNLYFYAPNSPIDPELSTQGAGTGTSGSIVRGLELGSAPATRNYGASIRITF